MKRFFAALAVPVLIAMSLPATVSAASLPQMIETYVTDFDMAEIDAQDRENIVAVHGRDDLHHGMKVLLIHDILLKTNALEHANMHFAEPEPFQLSAID